MTPAEAAAHLRPRVEGDREREILDAALEVLAEVGYDRLTMDAVAQRAKASKATLYRRWNSKATLVVDALARRSPRPPVPDSGDLRTDLLDGVLRAWAASPTTTPRRRSAPSMTAMSTDPEFAAEFRTQVLEPKSRVSRTVFERARDRGELRDDVDLDLIVPALAGIVLHRVLRPRASIPSPTLIERVIDQIILPAVRPQG